MKTLDDVLKTLRQLKPYLNERYYVSQLGVFGSQVRGNATEASDVDIYVEFEQPLGLQFITLGNELESTLGIKVDLADREMLRRIWPYVEGDMVYV